jgi:hypothetical protein
MEKVHRSTLVLKQGDDGESPKFKKVVNVFVFTRLLRTIREKD